MQLLDTKQQKFKNRILQKIYNEVHYLKLFTVMNIFGFQLNVFVYKLESVDIYCSSLKPIYLYRIKPMYLCKISTVWHLCICGYIYSMEPCICVDIYSMEPMYLCRYLQYGTYLFVQISTVWNLCICVEIYSMEPMYL